MRDEQHGGHVDQEVSTPLAHGRVDQEGNSTGEDEPSRSDTQGPWQEKQNGSYSLEAAKD
jgi:hypothetical protein